jgi:hypothetical protein
MRSSQITLVTFLGFAALLSTACGDDDPTGPTTEPFTASFTAEQVAAPGGRCPALTVSITGSGEAEPGGAFTIEQSHCVDPAGPNPLAVAEGQFTFTFASGATLTGTYTDVLVPTETAGVFNLNGAATFTGGTGEFAGASGSANATGTVNLLTGEASGLALTGTITH